MPLSVRVLGPVEVAVDGLVVPVERLQVRRLLALLAGTGEELAHDAVVDELWPGALPKDPRGALRVVVSRLRSVLRTESSCLRTTATGLVLHVDHLDVRTFTTAVAGGAASIAPEERLRIVEDALSLWRGRPFDGAVGPPALDRIAADVTSLRFEASVERADLLLSTGDPAGAAHAARPLVADRPHDERAARAMALGLARSGRRVEALRILARTRRRLRLDAGLTPSGPFIDAEREILAEAGPDTRVPPAANGRVRSMLLFGRTMVRNEVVAWLGRREWPVAVLAGSGGMGKTALAEALVTDLGLAATVVRFQAVADPGAANDCLDAFRRLTASWPIGPSENAHVARRAQTLRRRLAEGHGLIVLDDVHWATPAELRTIERALDASPASPVLITLRPHVAGDDRADLGRFVEQLRARGALVAELEGLERHQTRRMVVELSGHAVSATAADHFQRLTGGNPYLIRCLVDADAEMEQIGDISLPAMLQHAVTARLSGLDEADVRLLSTAGVLGERLDAEVLADVAERSLEQIVDWADRMAACGLLRAEPSLSFDHELTRVVLADQLGPATGRRSTAVQRTPAGARGRNDLTTARHILGAGGGDDAASRALLLSGAEIALARADFVTSRLLFERAAMHEEDPERRLEISIRLAWSLECAGRRDDAERVYDDVLAAARVARLSDLVARAALGGAAFGGVVGGNAARRRRLTDAMNDPPADPQLRVEVVTSLLAELRAADVDATAELTSTVNGLLGDDEAERAWMLAARLLDAADRPFDAERLALAVELERLAGLAGDVACLRRGQEILVVAHLGRGELDDARAVLGRLAATSRACVWPRYLWTTALLESLLTDLVRGPEAAEEAAHRAMAVGRELEIPDATNAYALFRLSVAQRTDQLAPLASLVERAAAANPRLAAWQAVHAACLADNAPVEAQQHLDEFSRLCVDSRLFGVVGWVFAARVAGRLGDRAVASAAVAQLTPWSGHLVIAGAGAVCFGPADLALADATAATDPTASARHRAAGAAMLRRIGAEDWPVAT